LENNHSQSSTRWLDFYAYFRLLIGGPGLLFIAACYTFNKSILISVTLILIGVLFIGEFFLIIKRNIWGWRFFWIILIIESYSVIYSKEYDLRTLCTRFMIVSAIWIAPNTIYFIKRKKLFTKNIKFSFNHK
jgi:hypothetical protein